MNSASSSISLLLIDTAFNMYILILWLRFLMQLVHADFYNPIAQFMVQATAPLVNSLRHIIPGTRYWEPSILVLIVLFKVIHIALVSVIASSAIPGLLHLVVITLFSLLAMLATFYFYLLFAMIILSWVAQGNYSPAVILIQQLSEPFMAPFRKILPPISGIDLSPIIAFLAIKIFEIILGNVAQGVFKSLGIISGSL